MKNKVFGVIIVIVIVTVVANSVVSYNSNNSICNYYDSLINECFTGVDKAELKYIIIIPNQGCGGCITYAEDFYLNNKCRNDMFFVFTNIVSLKVLYLDIKIRTENTLLDINNKFIEILPNDKIIYPIVLFIDNGKVKKIEFQSPDNNILDTM